MRVKTLISDGYFTDYHILLFVQSQHNQNQICFFNGMHAKLIFQCCFNVVFRLTQDRDVRQRQINFETMLCTSKFKFTTFNNVLNQR